MSNFSHCTLLPCTLLPTEAEAWGLFEAMKFALANGMSFVMLESDCEVIVDTVNSHQVPQYEIGDIISNCKDLLSTYVSFVVNHVRRQTNKVVYSLARASLSHNNPNILYDVSDYLYSLIINEMA